MAESVLSESATPIALSPPPSPTLPITTPLREQLKEATEKATGYVPYDWQVDIAEALCTRRDALCVAGTGSGKTLAFVMACLIDPQALVWIISPLNYIQKQQEKTFKAWGIKACSVNATTSYPGLHKVCAAHHVTSPTEYCNPGVGYSPREISGYHNLT
jgi:Rad3-related DNA helicase